MLNDFISVIDNCISEDDCQQYIDWIEHYISNGVVFKENVDYHTKDHFTINCNNHTEYDLLAGDNLSIYFLPTIKKPIDDYLKKFSTLGKEKLLIYDTKIKKIPMGGGFHDWHYENMGMQTSHRRFVVQLYLNDNFEGGETEFLYQNRRESAKEGEVLIFPAGYTHTHRGNPPIGGTKYLITTWAVFQDDE